MFKEIEDKDFKEKIHNSDLFKVLHYDINNFSLDIYVKYTNDETSVFCNYSEYKRRIFKEYPVLGEEPQYHDYSKEMESFINLLKDNKEYFKQQMLGEYKPDSNIEIIIECFEHYESNQGILIIVF